MTHVCSVASSQSIIIMDFLAPLSDHLLTCFLITLFTQPCRVWTLSVSFITRAITGKPSPLLSIMCWQFVSYFTHIEILIPLCGPLASYVTPEPERPAPLSLNLYWILPNWLSASSHTHVWRHQASRCVTIEFQYFLEQSLPRTSWLACTWDLVIVSVWGQRPFLGWVRSCRSQLLKLSKEAILASTFCRS